MVKFAEFKDRGQHFVSREEEHEIWAKPWRNQIEGYMGNNFSIFCIEAFHVYVQDLAFLFLNEI